MAKRYSRRTSPTLRPYLFNHYNGRDNNYYRIVEGTQAGAEGTGGRAQAIQGVNTGLPPYFSEDRNDSFIFGEGMRWLTKLRQLMTKKETVEETNANLSEHHKVLEHMDKVSEDLDRLNRKVSVGGLIHKAIRR